MKTDYLIAVFAICGTGLGNPLVTSNLALRAESSVDEALVQEFCLNMPAAASEEQKRACDGALEHVERRWVPHACHKFSSKGRSPFCHLPHRRPKRQGAYDAAETASENDDVSLAERDVSLKDSDLSRRFAQNEADADAGEDGAEGAGPLQERDEQASKLHWLLAQMIKKQCANPPSRLKALCTKFKAQGHRKREAAAASASNAEEWEKRSEQVKTGDDEESEGQDDEGL